MPQVVGMTQYQPQVTVQSVVLQSQFSYLQALPTSYAVMNIHHVQSGANQNPPT